VLSKNWTKCAVSLHSARDWKNASNTPDRLSRQNRFQRHGVSSATFYKWKAKFGGLDVSEAKRLTALEEENSRLKRRLADAMLDNAALKDLLGKKW
jgi:putative transposase